MPRTRSLLVSLLILIFVGCVLFLRRVPEKVEEEEKPSRPPQVKQTAILSRQQWLDSPTWRKRQIGQHLAVLVPYRDREEDLAEFLPIMTAHLSHLGLSYDIYIIEQQAEFRFNRGMLLNVGFLEATKSSTAQPGSRAATYVALHDIDMVPSLVLPEDADQREAEELGENEERLPLADYGWVAEARSLAVCVEQFGWRQPYPGYLGGVLLINAKAFHRAGGMPTRYWGWGAEDDDFADRLANAGVFVTRPSPYCLDALRNTRGKHTDRIEDPNRMSRLGASQRFADLDRLTNTHYKILNVTHPFPSVHHLVVELEVARWVRAAHNLPSR